MNDVNEIVICRSEYSSREEWENAIKKAVMVLLDNNYIMTVRYDEKGLGIVAIEYNCADQAYGYDYPYWLSSNEIDSVVTDKERKEIENEQDSEI